MSSPALSLSWWKLHRFLSGRGWGDEKKQIASILPLISGAWLPNQASSENRKGCENSRNNNNNSFYPFPRRHHSSHCLYLMVFLASNFACCSFSQASLFGGPFCNHVVWPVICWFWEKSGRVFWEGGQASGFFKMLGDTVSQLQHGDRSCHLPPYPQNLGTLRVNLGSTTRLSSKTLPRWQGELHTLMAMQLLPPVLAPAPHAHSWRWHSWAHCQTLCDPGRIAVSAYPFSHFKNQHSNA